MPFYPRHRPQPSAMTSASSLLLVILHYLRLCINYLLSFLSGGGTTNNRHGNSSSLTISLANLFPSQRRRQLLTFDNGKQVYIGDQIAEGGFSYVFEAFPANNNNTSSKKTLYALKRINCSDEELLQSCRHEAGIHRSLPRNHPNLLELLGLKFEQQQACSGGLGGANSSSLSIASSSSSLPEEYNVCYMLFPHLPHSLRGEITQRNLLLNYNDHDHRSSTRQPFTTVQVIHLFRGILDGLLAMHNANISHRDVKLENVLLSLPTTSYSDHHHNKANNNSFFLTPILIDYGSAGPLQTPPLTTRNSILQLIELASVHTTFPYRPPELSDVGNLRASSSSSTCSCVVDYGKVDVWSLGCVLFGLLHGVSPFEMEFVKDYGGNSNSGYGYGGGGRRRNNTVVGEQEDEEQQYGLVRIVECTTLKILGEVPFPPWAGSGLGGGNNTTTNNNPNNNTVVGDGRNGKYPLSMYKFIRYMVQQDRMSRPNICEVAKRFGELHYELLGEEWIPYSDSNGDGVSGRSRTVENDDGEEEQHDDFDSLIASRDFV
mmetsp:Transcript_13975/g.21622  ORF Transcript_13975/g.21622 Transcript_13975/m.21622 type:complete len:545 (-) Transcript_13975:58-1692(-)